MPLSQRQWWAVPALLLLAVIGIAAEAGVAPSAQPKSSSFPSGNITLIAGYPDGGLQSLLAQLIQQYNTPNLPAAGVNIRYSAATAAADHTSWQNIIHTKTDGSELTMIELPQYWYDQQKHINANDGIDFHTEDVSILYVLLYAPTVVVVSASNAFGITDVPSLIRYGQTNVITVTGVSGASVHRSLWTTFAASTNLEFQWIEYPSLGAGLHALLADNITVVLTTSSEVVSNRIVAEGALLPLAMAGNFRSDALPLVPTFSELGFNLQIGYYEALAVPKSVPESTKLALSNWLDGVNADTGYSSSIRANAVFELYYSYGPYLTNFLNSEQKHVMDTLYPYLQRDFIAGRSATVATFFFSLGIIIIAALMLVVYINRTHRVLFSASPWFAWLLLLGQGVALTCVWALLERPTPAICGARAYLSNIGFVLMISTILARIVHAYRNRDEPIKRLLPVPRRTLFLVTGIAVSVTVVLLGIFQAISPYAVDVVNFPLAADPLQQQQIVCTSGDATVSNNDPTVPTGPDSGDAAAGADGEDGSFEQLSYSLLVALKAGLLLVSIGFSYQLKSTPSPYDQLKYLSFSLYQNLLLFGSYEIVVFAFGASLSNQKQVLLHGALIICFVLLSICVIFIPLVLEIYRPTIPKGRNTLPRRGDEPPLAPPTTVPFFDADNDIPFDPIRSALRARRIETAAAAASIGKPRGDEDDDAAEQKRYSSAPGSKAPSRAPTAQGDDAAASLLDASRAQSERFQSVASNVSTISTSSSAFPSMVGPLPTPDQTPSEAESELRFLYGLLLEKYESLQSEAIAAIEKGSLIDHQLTNLESALGGLTSELQFQSDVLSATNANNAQANGQLSGGNGARPRLRARVAQVTNAVTATAAATAAAAASHVAVAAGTASPAQFDSTGSTDLSANLPVSSPATSAAPAASGGDDSDSLARPLLTA